MLWFFDGIMKQIQFRADVMFMKYVGVAENVQQLPAYGMPQAGIARLKQGTCNQSKVDGEVLRGEEVYFKGILTTEDTECTENGDGHKKTREVTKKNSSSSMRSFDIEYLSTKCAMCNVQCADLTPRDQFSEGTRGQTRGQAA